MPHPKVTVAIPTLASDDSLADCLKALETQTFQDFEVAVIDNSGSRKVREQSARVRIIFNDRNVGFGAAVNQAWRESSSSYCVCLNDDAVASPVWLERLVACAERNNRTGMVASEVRLKGTELLDSAGMRIAADGSAKQRGHRHPAADFSKEGPALFPSGSAALFRRAMLDEIGMFDERYFLYCEDTDLGLRARWAGWDCVYAAGAVVEHAYSQSAGRASRLKAYYVERNRILTVLKNFPARMLLRAPAASAARYFWHLVYLFRKQGAAADFRQSGESGWLLPVLVLRAHVTAFGALPFILADRRRLLRRISSREFARLLRQHSISVREVASL